MQPATLPGLVAVRQRCTGQSRTMLKCPLCTPPHEQQAGRPLLLQTKWDAFDPATADGFAGWLPGFYDAVEAAADTESRWLQGVLPAQVTAGFTPTPLTAWPQVLATCGTAAGMMVRGALSRLVVQ
jgi:hypothetical protein